MPFPALPQVFFCKSPQLMHLANMIPGGESTSGFNVNAKLKIEMLEKRLNAFQLKHCLRLFIADHKGALHYAALRCASPSSPPSLSSSSSSGPIVSNCSLRPFVTTHAAIEMLACRLLLLLPIFCWILFVYSYCCCSCCCNQCHCHCHLALLSLRLKWPKSRLSAMARHMDVNAFRQKAKQVHMYVCVYMCK